MHDYIFLAKTLIIIGALICFAGLLMLFVNNNFPLGKLPGDFLFRKGNVTFYFPLMTSLALSLILSILLSIFIRR